MSSIRAGLPQTGIRIRSNRQVMTGWSELVRVSSQRTGRVSVSDRLPAAGLFRAKQRIDDAHVGEGSFKRKTPRFLSSYESGKPFRLKRVLVDRW